MAGVTLRHRSLAMVIMLTLRIIPALRLPVNVLLAPSLEAEITTLNFHCLDKLYQTGYKQNHTNLFPLI